MMRLTFLQKWSVVLLLFSVLLAGCSSAPPVEFYTLNSLSATTEKAQSTDAATNIAVGVGPVEIPQAIDRPQIVTRTGPNKLTVDEFHRWAGPLESNLARVLAENIAFLLAIDRVAVYPWEVDFKPDYRIGLHINYFEGQWNKNVLLDVVWRVTDQKGQQMAVKKSVITEPLSAVDYEALVAAKSQAIARLSHDIVQEIRKLQSAKN
jgi:uncharacterized lipoprotein YmbA